MAYYNVLKGVILHGMTYKMTRLLIKRIVVVRPINKEASTGAGRRNMAGVLLR